MLTPGASSSLFSRVNTLTSTMMPYSPWGTRSEVSRTSRAFSPKMARSRRSSAVELGLALGGYLAHQNIAGTHFGAHTDNTALVQFLEDIFTHVGNIPGDLLRSELGVSGFDLIFLDVDRGVNIVPDQTSR